MTENAKEFVSFIDGEMVVNFMYEPPPPPEFRLYYDDTGNVLFYTGEKPEGNYIIVDALTFAAGRMDVKVIDNEIIHSCNILQVYKLVPSSTGVKTYSHDVSVIVNSKKDAAIWDLKCLQIRF